MSTIGFTGSQEFDHAGEGMLHLDQRLRQLVERYKPDTIVTGACIGYDAAIHLWFESCMPEIHRRVIVPANQAKVSIPILYDPNAEFIRMPQGTSYRARNEQIVENSDCMAAFWTGKRAYSGTFMTMNISNRAGKLHINDIFGTGILSDDEARYLYTNGDP